MCKSTLPGAESTVSQPKPQTQIVPCRLCGQPIELVPWIFNGRDLTLVTCENPQCAIRHYTFTLTGYKTVDLVEYLKRDKNS